MAAFNKDYLLEKIAEMEDGQYSMSDIFRKGEVPNDVSKELLSLVEAAGTVTVMDYADLGENSYDAFGVFCFLPEIKEDPCRNLSIVITLTEEVDQAGIYDLYQIMNRVNIRIPGGAFIISDDEKTLYFRTIVSIPKGASDEAALKIAGIRILDAVASVTDWIDVLMGLNDGDMDYDTCIERLNL